MGKTLLILYPTSIENTTPPRNDMRVPFGNDLGFIQEIPKTLVFGTCENQLNLRDQKPRSNPKQLLKVLALC